ncbi:MAG: ArsR family transcriptional regulator, partial [Methanomicrobiales archaeon]|nr:ArsR family transcriptional regulator [Methanomicrobiales archaeon]
MFFSPGERIPDRFGPEPLTERFQDMEEIALDRDDLAALSSDVRVTILKSLDTRPMT